MAGYLKRTLAGTRPKWRRLCRNITPTIPGCPPSKVQQPSVRCEDGREVGIAADHRLSASYPSHTAFVPIRNWRHKCPAENVIIGKLPVLTTLGLGNLLKTRLMQAFARGAGLSPIC